MFNFKTIVQLLIIKERLSFAEFSISEHSEESIDFQEYISLLLEIENSVNDMPPKNKLSFKADNHKFK